MDGGRSMQIGWCMHGRENAGLLLSSYTAAVGEKRPVRRERAAIVQGLSAVAREVGGEQNIYRSCVSMGNGGGRHPPPAPPVQGKRLSIRGLAGRAQGLPAPSLPFAALSPLSECPPGSPLGDHGKIPPHPFH